MATTLICHISVTIFFIWNYCIRKTITDANLPITDSTVRDACMSSVTLWNGPVTTTWFNLNFLLQAGGPCSNVGAYMPHEYCDKYMLCTPDKVYETFSCPSSLHWDAKHEVCNFPESAKCTGKLLETSQPESMVSMACSGKHAETIWVKHDW